MRKIAWNGAVVGFLLGMLAGGAIVRAVYEVPYAMAGDLWNWRDRMWLMRHGLDKMRERD